MRQIKKFNIIDIYNLYPEIYTTVFENWTTDGNQPSQVYLGYEDDKFGGFVSGYAHNKDTWYMQRAGFLKGEQHKIINLNRFLFVIDELHKEWKNILTLILNTDVSALKMAIKAGFKIIGVRMDTKSNLWVEMINVKEDSNA